MPKIVTSDLHVNNKIIWGERDAAQTNVYRNECHRRLKIIDFPHELQNCSDYTCTDFRHKLVIDTLYNRVINALCESAIVGRESRKHIRKNVVIGWNKHVSEVHRTAREKFLIWSSYGKPVSGQLFEDMRTARKMFKSRLKWCQDQEQQIKIDILASNHSKKDFRAFWKNTNKFNHKHSLPVCVDGVNDVQEIANVFKTHFEVKSPLGPPVSSVNAEPNQRLGVRITAADIKSVIKGMSRGKSPGHDGLSIEHLRHAGPHLPRILAMYFSIYV